MLSLGDLAQLATAIGVIFVVIELYMAQRLNQTAFEDSIEQQYRELLFIIPYEILLGKSPKDIENLEDSQLYEAKEAIYNYLHLCSHQIELRSKKRLRKSTWLEWQAGMKSHLAKPLIRDIWEQVKKMSPQELALLERLDQEQFNSDPAKWDS